MKIGIVYHDDLDGKCSAAIVYYYYKDKKNTKIDFISYNYSKEPDDLYEYDKLYIVDCVLESNLMTTLFEDHYKTNLIWIDHHVSNIMNTNSSIYGLRLPNDGAACVLTWNYFYGKIQIPDAVKYISDRDIWEFKYEKLTRGFTEWVEVQNNNPSNANLWFDLFDKDIGKYIDKGMIAYNARMRLIKNDVDKIAYESEIDGVKCLKMNYSSIYSISDACAYMLEKEYDIAWIWHRMKDGKIYNSLRSNGKYDVSEIALKYGGGGHKNAAGFIK